MKSSYEDLMNKAFGANKVPPEQLNKKVLAAVKEEIDMKQERKGLKENHFIRNICATAAALVLCFAASNGICFAATGQTWVSKVVVYINGEATEQEVVWSEDENGNVGFEVNMPEDEEGNVSVAVGFEDVDGELVPVDIDSEDISEVGGEVVREDGKIYFKYNDGKIDITNDFSDGTATGQFHSAGKEYSYIITEKDGAYDIVVFTEQ